MLENDNDQDKNIIETGIEFNSTVLQQVNKANNRNIKREKNTNEIEMEEINYKKLETEINEINISKEKNTKYKKTQIKTLEKTEKIKKRKVNQYLNDDNISSDENVEDTSYDENTSFDEDTSYDEESDNSSVSSSKTNSSFSECFHNNTDVARPHVSNQVRAKYCDNRGELKLPFNVDIMIPGTNDLDSENLRLLLRDTLPISRNIKCRMTFGTLRKNK